MQDLGAPQEAVKPKLLSGFPKHQHQQFIAIWFGLTGIWKEEARSPVQPELPSWLTQHQHQQCFSICWWLYWSAELFGWKLCHKLWIWKEEARSPVQSGNYIILQKFLPGRTDLQGLLILIPLNSFILT